MENKEQSKVGNFFNDISSTYKNKYRKGETFHYYFFRERLEKAVKNIDMTDSKILDIGAGTGDLYDFIVEQFPSISYSGTDIAPGMLENSSIPENCRFLGDYTTLQLPHTNYKVGFMLGVSTYLSPNQMEGYMDLFYNHLDEKLVISFTNKYCFDNFFRKLLKPILSLLPNKKNVLAQKIDISTYTLAEASKYFEGRFEVESVEWLNHTVFPFNLIFEKLSIKIANKLDLMKSPFLLSLFSSDFIIKAKKVKP